MARHKIRGKVWEVRYVPNMSNDGECDEPTAKGKQIRIAQRCKGKRRLEILIHEALHAALWDLDESVVTEIGRDMANLLWRELEL